MARGVNTANHPGRRVDTRYTGGSYDPDAGYIYSARGDDRLYGTWVGEHPTFGLNDSALEAGMYRIGHVTTRDGTTGNRVEHSITARERRDKRWDFKIESQAVLPGERRTRWVATEGRESSPQGQRGWRTPYRAAIAGHHFAKENGDAEFPRKSPWR